jgi:hypothetical protein
MLFGGFPSHWASVRTRLMVAEATQVLAEVNDEFLLRGGFTLNFFSGAAGVQQNPGTGFLH